MKKDFPIPTDQQRLKIYLEALQVLKKDKMKFICVCILDIYERINKMNVPDDAAVLGLFPEFVNQKPEGELLDGSWFGHPDKNKKAHSQRIEVLKNCIEILNNK